MKNKYEIRGGITIVDVLYRGRRVQFKIDTSDLPLVDSFPNTWMAHVETRKRYIYIFGVRKIGEKTRRFALHRFITEAPEGMVVDHVNHDASDNRRSNLRVVTHAENLQNQKDPYLNNQYSGTKNVYYNKSTSNWKVTIAHNNKVYWFGQYDDLSTAEDISKKARAFLLPASVEARTMQLSAEDVDFLQNISRIYGRKVGTPAKIGGICWVNRHNMWRVRIVRNKKGLYEKLFKDYSEAESVLNALRRKYSS